MTPLVAYLLLFVAVGVGFIFVHLVAGKLIRPSTPNVEKGTIYECGEPTIGSAWVQFDLREDLATVRPTVLLGVPRLFELMSAAVARSVERSVVKLPKVARVRA